MEFNTGVCYRHFHEHDIVLSHKRNKSGHVRIKKILKSTAVPTLHLTNDFSSRKVKQFPNTKEQKEEIIKYEQKIGQMYYSKTINSRKTY